MNTVELLAKVRSTYRACRTYRDSGTTALRADPLATFTTEYRRDADELRFSYRVEANEWLELEGTRGKVASYRSSPPEVAARDELTSDTPLRRATGRLAGITFGASSIVPTLLVPEWLGGSFEGECAMLASERLEGKPSKWIYFGGGFAVAIEVGTWHVRRAAAFLSDVVSADGRVLRASDPAVPLSLRAYSLTCYEVHELA